MGAPVHAVYAAVERLMHASNGKGSFLLVDLTDGPAEMVLVRRDDLALLLATWVEKREMMSGPEILR